MQKNTKFWDNKRGVIRTKKGGWIIGKGVNSHGFSLLEDLVGQVSFFEVMILNVTGKMPEQPFAKWLEATFICMSWPDPRIWCNYIGTLGGTVRTSPVAAVCAGTLAGDSRMYGPGTVNAVTEFISESLQKRTRGYPVEQILAEQREGSKKRFSFPGYARPIAKGDERVGAMQRVATALGYKIGPHLQLAYDIENVLMEQYGESMNLAGYMMSFMLDQEYSQTEIYRLVSLCVNGGIHACYAEAADSAPESFLPLRCDDIEYSGHSERSLPVPPD